MSATKVISGEVTDPKKWTTADWVIAVLIVGGLVALVLWLLGVFDTDDVVITVSGAVTTTTPTPTPSSRISGTQF